MSQYRRGGIDHLPFESNLETELDKLFSNARTNGTMDWDLLTGEKIVLAYTLPDYVCREKMILFYLDGPPHLKERVSRRDEELDALIAKQGYRTHRIPYTPPVSKTRLREIFEEIKGVVNGTIPLEL